MPRARGTANLADGREQSVRGRGGGIRGCSEAWGSGVRGGSETWVE